MKVFSPWNWKRNVGTPIVFVPLVMCEKMTKNGIVTTRPIKQRCLRNMRWSLKMSQPKYFQSWINPKMSL
ncbi:hypothetical protein FKM82_028721 [Ascaphus truei]